MKAWTRLIIPITLGIIAASFNWLAFAHHFEEETYLVAKTKLKKGQNLAASDFSLLKANVPKQFNRLAVKRSEVTTILGRPLKYELKPGSLISHGDVSLISANGPSSDDIKPVPFERRRLKLLASGDLIPEESEIVVRVNDETGDRNQTIALPPFTVLRVEGEKVDDQIITLALEITKSGNETRESQQLQTAYDRGKIIRSYSRRNRK